MHSGSVRKRSVCSSHGNRRARTDLQSCCVAACPLPRLEECRFPALCQALGQEQRFGSAREQGLQWTMVTANGVTANLLQQKKASITAQTHTPSMSGMGEGGRGREGQDHRGGCDHPDTCPTRERGRTLRKAGKSALPTSLGGLRPAGTCPTVLEAWRRRLRRRSESPRDGSTFSIGGRGSRVEVSRRNRDTMGVP